MKKLIATITILAALLVFAGCCKDTETTTSTTSTIIETEEISFKAEDLIRSYCDGTWNGQFSSTTEHCASIEDGVLWLDCHETEWVPDMGPLDYPSSFNEVVDSSDGGTWVHNTNCQTVELWSKGFRKESFPLNTENAYSTSVYKIEGGFAVHCGSSLSIVDHHGYGRFSSFEDVIDVFETGDGVWFSTFEHENYLIVGVDDEVTKVDTSYVRYPDTPGNLVHSDDIRLTQAFNLFYGEGWNGELRRMDNGEFMLVDEYDGNIVVNNKIIGNVCLGDSVVEDYGHNIYLDVDRSYYLDGSKLIYFQHGPIDRTVDVPDGTAKFLRIFNHYDTKGNYTGTTIAAQSGDTLYIVENDGSVNIIAEGIVDACVAYDTLYYMVEDVVYSLDWLNPDATPEVYFKGAYAVSHHTDEAEGALVPQEGANYKAYGYSNIYSPYGHTVVPSAQQRQEQYRAFKQQQPQIVFQQTKFFKKAMAL